MRSMVGPGSLIALLAVLCAGCVSLDDTFEVTPFLHEQITGDSWRACLARGYQFQTRLILRQGRDWTAASRFSAKGWTVLNEGDAAPWSPAEFAPDVQSRGELDQARSELAALLTGKASAPCPCAQAQAAYDGWLAASARPGANVAAARSSFTGALATCRQAEASPR
jgi:hypothetical protein